MSQAEAHTYPLTDPRALVDLHPLLHRMRREDPVHWSEQLHGWVLTRYDDVVRAFRDHRLSSQRMELLVRYQLRDSDPELARDFLRSGRQQMLYKDGAEHHRLRVLGNRGFTPSTLQRSRPMIEAVVNELLDRVAAAGRMDFVADFAQPLPALVIADLFGIPSADRGLFQEWSDALAVFFGGALGDPEAAARAANDAILKLEAYFLDLLEERRRRPGEDLMSLFVEGQAEGKLSAAEVTAQCILVLAAGHVTTIDQLSNAVHAFLHHPDQLERLRTEPGLITSAVEEVLRFDGAASFTHRQAIADVSFGGKTIRPGQIVYVGIAAANRDPEVFPDPDRFDIARTDNHHVAFAVGPHVCLGAGLARRELEIALPILFRRLPQLRLDEARPAARKCESLVFRGFDTLPVLF
jgi:cytochrome P450 PksS